MPELNVELTEEQELLLESIRHQEGLATIDQAAEWLLKQRLKQSSLKLTGRNRAIHAVGSSRK
jgi:hypothetical protein